MSAPDTSHLRSVRAAGTAGEWSRMDPDEAKRRFGTDRVIIAADDGMPDEPWAVAFMARGPKFEWQDATLIVTAVNQLIPLCDEVESLRRERDSLLARLTEIESLVRCCDGEGGCRAWKCLPENAAKQIHES